MRTIWFRQLKLYTISRHNEPFSSFKRVSKIPLSSSVVCGVVWCCGGGPGGGGGGVCDDYIVNVWPFSLCHSYSILNLKSNHRTLHK